MRLLFTIIISLSVTGSTVAQTFIKGGLNVASVAKVDDSRPLFSFHLGVGGVKNLNKVLSIKPEFIFSGQGLKTPGTSFRNYYINMPVLLEMKAGSKFFFESGAQLGIAIDAKDNRNTGFGVAKLNTIDISFCAGMAYGLTTNFLVGIRYCAGLTNTIRISDDNYNYANKVAQLSFNYRFTKKEASNE